MNEPKWTPGPWAWGNGAEEVKPGATDTTELLAYGQADAKGNQDILEILDIWESEWTEQCPTLRINPHNASLIVAAPLLYVALAGLLTGHPSGDSPEQKIGRAALAKARGESQ